MVPALDLDSPRAGREAPATARVPRPPVALYVHFPFCVSLCPYCDFVVYAGASATGPRNRVAPLARALAAELHLRADAAESAFGPSHRRPPPRSVYFGGGSPSLLDPAEVRSLLRLIADRFGLAEDAEVTLEANPGRAELGDLPRLREAGVTRLSLGGQSLEARELRRIGRRHSAEDVRAAVGAARAAGFRSVSIDVLYDLPGQTPDSWARTLDGIVELGVDHVSAYALSLEDPDSEGLTGPSGDHLPLRPGARRWRERARREQDGDRAADLYAQADERLAAAGFAWYEISNWARPGHESRHNLAYWRGLAYEAVGPGSHAYDGSVRRWNAAPLDAYLGALTPGDRSSPRLPPGGRDEPDEATWRAERLILG
ncbi:MAG: coproporphyrinogen III oxidase family protein, partial [Chloroflexota bacterium]|nr:coproporphyrinogen III oxidase family protein [Chloroflexota bacterium]